MLQLSRKLLCLDWDKRALRIVVARVGGGRMTLEDAHAHRLPDNVDSDDPQTMGPYIHQMLRRHGLRQKTVVVDVPRERAVINRLALPPTPPGEVAAAVRFRAMKELPFPVETAAVDYVVTARDESGNATQVVLAAVTTETLERVRATCEAAGLTPSRIGLRPYANLVSVCRLPAVAGQRTLFVDVGPAATEIDVISADALAFARSANVNVPLLPPEAAAREQTEVFPLAPVSETEADEEARSCAVDELLVEVTRTLQAYRATEPDAAIDQVVIAGGTGIEEQLGEALHRRLDMPITLFDPTGPLRIDPAEGPKLRSFPAALGLAWGLAREGLLAIDFLNPKRPVSAHEALKRRLQIIGVAAGILVVCLGAYRGKQYWDQTRLLKSLRDGNATRQKELTKKTELRNRNEEVQEWATDAQWLDELERVTECAIEPGKKMVVQEITLDSASRTPGITVRNVYAADWQVLKDFVGKLNALRVGGQRWFQASAGTETEVRDAELFKTKADVQIELLDLRELREKAPQREKARKDDLRPL